MLKDIQINNVGALGNHETYQVELPGQANIVCGPNASAKTTLCRTLRALLSKDEDPARIGPKGYKAYMGPGDDAPEAVVMFDDGSTRTWCISSKDFEEDGEPPRVGKIVSGIKSPIFETSPAEASKFWTAVLPTRGNLDDLREAALAIAAAQDENFRSVDYIVNFLPQKLDTSADWDMFHKNMVRQLSDKRKTWATVVQASASGALKGETMYKRTMAMKVESSVDSHDIGKLDDKLKDLHKQIGAAEAFERMTRDASRTAVLDDKLNDLDERIREIGKFDKDGINKEAAAIAADLRAVEGNIKDLEANLKFTDAKCPACSNEFKIFEDEPEDLVLARKEHSELRNLLVSKREEIRSHETELKRAQSARDQTMRERDNLKADQEAALDSKASEENLTSLQDQAQTLQEIIRKARTRSQHEDTLVRAMQYAREAIAMEIIIALAAPDGMRLEERKKYVREINEKISEIAKAGGWKVALPVLTYGNMLFQIKRRPWQLASKSEQWSAAALLQMAGAAMVRKRSATAPVYMIFDGMDILDQESRGGFLRCMWNMASESDMSGAMATCTDMDEDELADLKPPASTFNLVKI